VATASRLGFLAGVSGAATLPAGCPAKRVLAYSANGGTMVLTLQGAVSALPTVTLPAGAPWLVLDYSVERDEVPGGSSFVFSGTSSYLIEYENVGGGA
jgi:hypothetical protein